MYPIPIKNIGNIKDFSKYHLLTVFSRHIYVSLSSSGLRSCNERTIITTMMILMIKKFLTIAASSCIIIYLMFDKRNFSSVVRWACKNKQHKLQHIKRSKKIYTPIDCRSVMIKILFLWLKIATAIQPNLVWVLNFVCLRWWVSKFL